MQSSFTNLTTLEVCCLAAISILAVAVSAVAPAPASSLESSLAPFSDLRSESPSPRHHQRAEILFRLGCFSESVADYGVAARGGAPHDEDSCWERGLALYYAGDYAGGAAQFARYHSVGTTDVENGLWHFLCLAEAEVLEKWFEPQIFANERKYLGVPVIGDGCHSARRASAAYNPGQRLGKVAKKTYAL